VNRHLSRLVQSVRKRLRRITPGKDGFAIDEREKEWRRRHQPFELEFHQRDNFRWDDAQFMAQWEELFGRFCGFDVGQFNSSGAILDLGCGSRPAFDWFDDACEKYHLDPLLDRYIQIPQVAQYWSAKPAESRLAAPAERFIEALDERCSFVNCWNVLDHTYDWRSILLNLWRYSADRGYVLLGTDIVSHGDGHPGIDDPAFLWDFIQTHFEIVKRQENYVGREYALLMRKRSVQ